MLRFTASLREDMHMSHLRIALVNYLVSVQKEQPFLIRINDIGHQETLEGRDTEIMHILEKFALTHTSVFHQSEHRHMHQTMAIRLLEQKKAFVCTCKTEMCSSETCAAYTQKELSVLKEKKIPFVLRIKKPTEDIVYQDSLKGSVSVSAETIHSFIILNTEGDPTEVFANACDDILSGITVSICEEKHITESAKEQYIQKALGFSAEIQRIHIPTLNSDENTLSIKKLFEHGYIPDAIINYILLLGNANVPAKIFTLPEAISWFDIANLKTQHITIEEEMLRLINKEHLKRMDDKTLSSLFGFADADIGKLAKLYLEEASTVNELASKINAVFAPKLLEGEYAKEMRLIQEVILQAPMINDFNTFVNHIMQKSGLQSTVCEMSLRFLLTGSLTGPELSEIYPLVKSYILEIVS